MNSNKSNKVLQQQDIQKLFDKYMSLVKFEIEELGCKPTELRHLVGRLGEFYCALETNGSLAHEPNQHGFDVISSSGKAISVKTTAQKKGFVRLNKNTLDKVNELMLIQFKDCKLEIICHCPIGKAIEAVRRGNHWELDIPKARKIGIIIP